MMMASSVTIEVSSTRGERHRLNLLGSLGLILASSALTNSIIRTYPGGAPSVGKARDVGGRMTV